jgi:hypothetical protein
LVVSSAAQVRSSAKVTVTITGTIIWSTGTLTYTSGTMVVTGSTLVIGSGGAGGGTLACSGITWETVQFNGSSTTTLSADLNVSDEVILNPDNASTRTVNGNAINLSGDLTVAGVSSTGKTVAGTTVIVLDGTGTWSQTVASTQMRLPITINTAGTITVSGTVRYNTGTITYTAGTIVQASTGTITVDGGTATVFDFGGGDLGDVTLQITTAGVILNLASELVIATAGALVCTGTAASLVGIRSNATPTQRALTITPGASIDVGYCNFTDIDNSAGALMHVFKGTISNSLNIQQFTPYDAPFSTGSGSGEHSVVF